MAAILKSAAAPDPNAVEPDESAEPVAEEQAGTAPEEAGEALDPKAIRAKIKVPPNLKKAYDRVVLAGMKIMFDQQTHQAAIKLLMQGNGPISERLGTAIATLMGTLVKQSNGTLPPQLIIPAGVELLVAAADFIKKSGVAPITKQDVGEALSVFVDKIMQAAGVKDPAQLQALVQQAKGQGRQPAAPTGAPGPAELPARSSVTPANAGMTNGILTQPAGV